MRKQRFNTPHNRETGVVLIASLLLLLIVTVLGISTSRDIVLQEKMSSNFRMKTLTFETANSAVQDQWPGLMQTLPGEGVTDVRTRTFNAEYDQDWDADGTTDLDLNVGASICYRGSDIAPGTDSDFSAYLFEMTTQADEANGTISQVRQSGYIVAEASDVVLPASCP